MQISILSMSIAALFYIAFLILAYGLISKLRIDPNNKSLILEIAEKYFTLNQNEEGFNKLLDLFNRDSKWNDEIAKKKLLEYFDLLGFNDPNVIIARKKLSSMMFK